MVFKMTESPFENFSVKKKSVMSFFDTQKNDTKNTIISFLTDNPKAKKIKKPEEPIKIRYKEDYNIILVHDKIRDLFSFKLNEVDIMEKEIFKLESKLETKLKIIEYNDIKDKIKNIQKNISDIKSGSMWRKYFKEAKPFLEEYITLASDDSKGICYIGNNLNESNFTDEQKYRRFEVIESYLDVAKIYIDIDYLWEHDEIPKCIQCGVNLEDVEKDHDTDLYVCECGILVNKLDKESQYERPGHSGSTSKIYNSRVSFEKAFTRYQGISSDPIPDKLFEQLDSYFVNNNFLTGEQVRALPSNSRGKKNGTSIKLLESALKHTNNSDHYTIIYAISYLYWGWTPPEIGHLKDIIMEKYDRNQKIYEKNKSRKACLNVYLHLFELLRDSGHICELDDFKSLVTEKSIIYHNEQFELISQETGMKFTELV